MFMKSTTGVNIIKRFFSSFLLLLQNKLARLYLVCLTFASEAGYPYYKAFSRRPQDHPKKTEN
jgi:hypothetical protein